MIRHIVKRARTGPAEKKSVKCHNVNNSSSRSRQQNVSRPSSSGVCPPLSTAISTSFLRCLVFCRVNDKICFVIIAHYFLPPVGRQYSRNSEQSGGRGETYRDQGVPLTRTESSADPVTLPSSLSDYLTSSSREDNKHFAAPVGWPG